VRHDHCGVALPVDVHMHRKGVPPRLEPELVGIRVPDSWGRRQLAAVISRAAAFQPLGAPEVMPSSGSTTSVVRHHILNLSGPHAHERPPLSEEQRRTEALLAAAIAIEHVGQFHTSS
jgi:hypothetical protein